MRSFARGFVLMLALARVSADAGAGEPAAPEAPCPLTAVKLRTRRYMESARAFSTVCPACKGVGFQDRASVIGGKMRTERFACPGCDHSGIQADGFAVRRWIAFYRSPAWRAQEGFRAAVDEAVAAFGRSLTRSTSLPCATIWDAKLLDDGHAEVVLKGEDWGQVQLRWLRAVDPKGSEEVWWLWTKGFDGPWPGDPSTAGADPVIDLTTDDHASALEPVSASVSGALAQRLAAEAVRSSLVAVHRVGGRLVLTLRNRSVATEVDLRKAIAREIVPATRASFDLDPTVVRVSLRFLATFRDPCGALRVHVCETADVTRATYDKIPPERLRTEAILCVFAHTRVSHEGATVCFQE